MLNSCHVATLDSSSRCADLQTMTAAHSAPSHGYNPGLTPHAASRSFVNRFSIYCKPKLNILPITKTSQAFTSSPVSSSRSQQPPLHCCLMLPTVSQPPGMPAIARGTCCCAATLALQPPSTSNSTPVKEPGVTVRSQPSRSHPCSTASRLHHNAARRSCPTPLHGSTRQCSSHSCQQA
jgi:hypothetical protein